MSVLNELHYAGGFLISEANGGLSRDGGVIANAGGAALLLDAGLVLAKAFLGAASAVAKAGGNTGTGTLTLDVTTPILAGAKPGVYAVRCIAAATNGGTFRVEDPDGYVLGEVAVAATFADDVKFVIADGGIDFIVGDGFDITIAAGDGKWAPFTNAATQRAQGILFDRATVPAAGSKAVTVITRQAEVNAAELVWDASLAGGALTAAIAAAKASLAEVGIILR